MKIHWLKFQPMYDLPQYEEPDPQVKKQFIQEHPFAFLYGCDAQNYPVLMQKRSQPK